MKSISFSWEEAGVSKDEIEELKASMDEYTAHLQSVTNDGGFEDLEASLNAPSTGTDDILQAVERFSNDDLKYVIIIGIGGSNLGTKAVYDALYGELDAFDAERRPKLVFLDTASPTLLQNVKDLLIEVNEPEEVVVNVISKSGGTMETIANFESMYQFMRERFGKADSRFVLTTDEDSKLAEAATDGMTVLTIPKMVGGRFSVFAAVGLFPLALAGIDVEMLLSGAVGIRDRCLGGDNIALESAALTLHHFEDDVRINNSFFFNPELESAGKWYRQLMGESIGKREDLDGKEVHRGITPIVSIGSADLHSMAQLYFGGPRDKFTSFVYASQDQVKSSVPKIPEFGLVDGLEGKTYAELMSAIYDGVKAAYRKNSLPYAEVDLKEISEYTIGQFLQFKMLEMMYLARLLNLNAFDQPAVEDYKIETKGILRA